MELITNMPINIFGERVRFISEILAFFCDRKFEIIHHDFFNCSDGGCGFAIQGSCDSDESKFFCEGR